MKPSTTLKLMAVLFITAFLISCGGKSDKTKEDKIPDDTAKVVPTEPTVIIPEEPKLVCKELGEDSMSIPHFDVMLVANGKETKIKSVNGCGTILKTEYKTYDIPEEAISACGGWYAGGGDYYYLTKVNGKLSVFEGWREEGQTEKGFHWKEITLK